MSINTKSEKINKCDNTNNTVSGNIEKAAKIIYTSLI